MFAIFTGSPAALSGCATTESAATQGASASSSSEDSGLELPAASYAAAFDIAAQTVRDKGFTPMLLDRRSGVIETEPLLSGTLIDPWRDVDHSLSQTAENTLHMQRRRVRIEFRPTAFDPRPRGESPAADVLALDRPPIDLTTSQSPLRMHVSVVVERRYNPAIQQATWSVQTASLSPAVDPNTGEALTETTWTAVRVDRRTAGIIERAIGDRIR